MKRQGRRRIEALFSKMILQILLKEGPLGPDELAQNPTVLSFYFRVFQEQDKGHQVKPDENVDIEFACNELINQKLLHFNDAGKYELTEAGKTQAEYDEHRSRKGLTFLKTKVLTPTAAVRNSMISVGFLAVAQLLVGFFSGSVALIADGTDNCVSTVSSGIVWLGLRLKKETACAVTIIVLMIVSAVSIGANSAISLLNGISNSFLPISMPYSVIIVESAALIFALVLSSYQRFVGKRSRSLVLISQSIDSRNNILYSAAVIASAIFSVVGVYWFDAIVGGFIAIKITYDGLNLLRDVFNSSKGHTPDFEKFKLPFEERIQRRQIESFRLWILYALQKEKIHTKQEIIGSLKKTYAQKSAPSLMVQAAFGEEYDFEKNFEDLLKPLVENAYVLENEGNFILSEKGSAHIKKMLRKLRYNQTAI